MNYEKSKLVLQYGLLIDMESESSLLNQNTVHENPEKIIETLLWKTVFQCNDYFITDDFFGPEPPSEDTDLTKRQLVTGLNEHFEYLQRRIILENVAMDLYLSLGRKVHAENAIIDGAKYLAVFFGKGYNQMKNGILNKNSYKINKEILESEGERLYPAASLTAAHPYDSDLKNRYRQLSQLMESDYIKQCENTNQDFREFLKRIVKHTTEKNKSIQIPVFDCRLVATAVLNIKTIDQMCMIPKEQDSAKKFAMINEHRTSIVRLEFGGDGSPKPETADKFLDDNIYRYCLEKYLHGKLQHEVLHICNKLSEEYNLIASYLQDALIDTVNMNIQFGMEYLLEYPLQYIHSPFIQMDDKSWYQNHKSYHLNENEAEKIWINKYCQYLETLSYAIIPVVRTTFQLNLYEYCKNIVSTKNQDNIEREMFGLLEEYEKCNSQCVNYDFSSLCSKAQFPSYKSYYLHILDKKVDEIITKSLELKGECCFKAFPQISLPNIKKDEYFSNIIMEKIYGM